MAKHPFPEVEFIANMAKIGYSIGSIVRKPGVPWNGIMAAVYGDKPVLFFVHRAYLDYQWHIDVREGVRGMTVAKMLMFRVAQGWRIHYSAGWGEWFQGKEINFNNIKFSIVQWGQT
jgi:hypothetical protein